jgi:hypothetical protein
VLPDQVIERQRWGISHYGELWSGIRNLWKMKEVELSRTRKGKHLGKETHQKAKQKRRGGRRNLHECMNLVNWEAERV